MITCFFENGNQAKGEGLRHVTTVAMVVDRIDAPTRILLARRAESLRTCPGQWAFPGGFLDRDEKVIEGARREILEETGYQVRGELQFLGYDDTPERGDDRQNVVFIWWGEAGEKVSEADQESSEVRWFDLDKLPEESEWAFNHFSYINRFLKK